MMGLLSTRPLKKEILYSTFGLDLEQINSLSLKRMKCVGFVMRKKKMNLSFFSGNLHQSCKCNLFQKTYRCDV